MTSPATARGTDRKIHTITITEDANGNVISVEPDTLTISKPGQDEVTWKTITGEGFFVDFGGNSPFYESEFDKTNFVSGPVRRGVLADPKKVYKYSVRTKGVGLDPGIIVNP